MKGNLWLSAENETLIPIGVPTPWLLNLRPIPANCLECNGQNVEEPSSPLYGCELPNLNSGMPLVGSLGDTGLVADAYEIAPAAQPKGVTCRWVIRIK